jgi:ABC-type transporter MlaC component
MKTLLLCLLLSSFVLATESSPVHVIRQKDQELQALLKKHQKNPTQEMTQQLKVMINSIFDFEEMGRRVLPRETLNSESKEKISEFIAAFKSSVENSSVPYTTLKM